MARASIITLVSVLFSLSLIVINGALVFEYKRQSHDVQFLTFQRFMMGVKILFDNPHDKDAQLAKLHVKRSSYSKEKLLRDGEKVIDDPFSQMVVYENQLFFIPKPPPPHHHFNEPPKLDMPPPPRDLPILEDTNTFSPQRLWILSGVINVSFILFFGIVLRKLLRLKNLKRAIMRFGEEQDFKAMRIEAEDELGEIAHEFNIAMEKIHLLKESRALFLRNILHELKTPIMKGKIISQSLENISKKEQLERAFERLESLLGEMVKVEKLSSNEWELHKKEYRLVDICDHAMDLVMSDTKRFHIKTEKSGPLLEVDFELFATALKNLLDNALKHSIGDIEVSLGVKSIKVCSNGTQIPEKRLDFSRPFNREMEGSTTGLGLGLYIANAIVVKHGFSLHYKYLEAKNCFEINF
ncbi:MAG: ArsS family sensor histidine kinase [Sulfurospirillaceae bacterium]|nr:ArsS family sensor histidine kinase [Sulfurospirillaceae bacterium]